MIALYLYIWYYFSQNRKKRQEEIKTLKTNNYIVQDKMITLFKYIETIDSIKLDIYSYRMW